MMHTVLYLASRPAQAVVGVGRIFRPCVTLAIVHGELCKSALGGVALVSGPPGPPKKHSEYTHTHTQGCGFPMLRRLVVERSA